MFLLYVYSPVESLFKLETFGRERAFDFGFGVRNASFPLFKLEAPLL